MYERVEKQKENKKRTFSNSVVQEKDKCEKGFVRNNAAFNTNNKFDRITNSSPVPLGNLITMQLAQADQNIANGRSRHVAPPNHTRFADQRWGGERMSVTLQIGNGPNGTAPGNGTVPSTKLPIIATHLNGNYGNAFWKEGHLLNQQLGGLGKTKNMTPLTSSANGQFNTIDSVLKNIFPSDPTTLNLALQNPELLNLRIENRVEATGVIDHVTLGDPIMANFPTEFRQTLIDHTPGGAGNLDWGLQATRKQKLLHAIANPKTIDNRGIQ